MLNEEFIKSCLTESVYRLKEGTKGSYYWQSGSHLLPNRLSISKNEVSPVNKSGRNSLNRVAGQLLSNFTQKEESLLKKVKPYTLRTQIWSIPEYPLFVGFGTIGIMTEVEESFDEKIEVVKRVKDTGDLILLYSGDNWQTIRIFFFAGLGENPDYLLPCFEYANKLIY
jgi:hypothetical protein